MNRRINGEYLDKKLLKTQMKNYVCVCSCKSPNCLNSEIEKSKEK